MLTWMVFAETVTLILLLKINNPNTVYSHVWCPRVYFNINWISILGTVLHIQSLIVRFSLSLFKFINFSS